VRVVVEVSERGIKHSIRGARTPEQVERAARLWVLVLPLILGIQSTLRLQRLARQQEVKSDEE
jgi:hypothetical protein